MAGSRFWLGFLVSLLLVGRAAALDPDKPFSQYVIDRWSVQDGFPQVSALQIVQDRTGYIWASTQSGLARFDGVRFTTFNVRTTPELLTDHLEVLHVDQAGALWIGSNRGLTVKRGADFTVVIEEDQRVGPVLALAEGPEGELWLGAEGGLFRVAETVEVLNEPVYSLHRSAAELWAGSVGALYRVAGDRVDRLPLPDPDARIEHLSADGEGLWLGTTRGLYRLDRGEPIALVDDLTPELAGDAKIEALYRDSDGALWIGTYEYLIRRLPDGRREIIGRDTLGFRPWIVSIAEDREGNLWLGSNTHSLIRLWDGWTRRYSTAEGLSDPFVWSVAVDPDDGIWIGTNSGLSFMADGQIDMVLSGERLINPAVYSLLVEGPGCLWLGTRGGLEYYCEGSLLTPTAMSALAGLQINALLQRRDGLWIGTSEGLYRWSDDELTAVPGLERNSERIRILHELSDDRLLIGTEAGLFTAGESGIEAVGGSEALGAAFVTAIAGLPDGRTAVGTLGRGLFLGDPGRGWIRVGPEHGLPTGALFYLDISPDGFLWVGGEVGAYRVEFGSLPSASATEPTPLAVQNLASSNQLSGSDPARCCNGAGSAKGLYYLGSYWFPTLDGVLEVQPEKIESTSPHAPVVIESLEANGTVYLATGQGLELPPRERDFSVQFTALTFQDPRNVLFRYRLVGYDDEWVWAGRRRTAYFTNLPPGEYRFQVSAASSPGQWSDQVAELPLTLQPTIYESLWFKLLLGLLAVALLIGIYAFRTREARRVRQRLERLVGERTRALDEANRLLRLANRKLEEASESDPLTGLSNRRFVQNRLQPGTPAHEQLFAKNRMPMLVLLADIDRFKQVNDLHGHAAGDEVLKQFAELLNSQIREGDAAVRWGGEEFLLLLGNTQDERATAVAERLRAAVEQHRFELEGATLIRMTCSFGVAPLTAEDENDFGARWGAALELADRALYAVKEGGRNGWAVIDAARLGRVPAGQEPSVTVDRVVQAGDIQIRSSRREVTEAFFAAAQDRERTSFS